MKPYTSQSGKKSGVIAYELGDDYIIVQFLDGTYKYTHVSAGETVIDIMKALAIKQQGLSTFIAQHRPGYESRS